MADIQYGVVHQDGRWTLIGRNLRYGAFRSRARAERAARQLAHSCGGLPVELHVQDETGELRPPKRIAPADVSARPRHGARRADARLR